MDIVAKRYWFIGASALAIAIGVVVLAFPPHLNLGIDFTSGTSITVEFDGAPDRAAVRSALVAAGHDEAIIQRSGQGVFLIRMGDLGATGRDAVERELTNRVGIPFAITEVTTVGRSVAEDTVRNAVIAVVVAATFVMLYVMWAFRSVPRSYRYALAAILALMHDVLIVLGLFAILGRVMSAEVNAIFIVGILTVIGYSVHDTIVIFDRIRENVRLAPNRPFATSVNISIRESTARSLGTSITTAMVILAMLLFGGETLRDFLIVLLAGVIVGTYSSLFLAAQVLVIWEYGELRRILFWRRGEGATAQPA